jgi:hypothetical protein
MVARALLARGGRRARGGDLGIARDLARRIHGGWSISRELALRALLAERVHVADPVRPEAPADRLRLVLSEHAAAVRATHRRRRERDGVSPRPQRTHRRQQRMRSQCATQDLVCFTCRGRREFSREPENSGRARGGRNHPPPWRQQLSFTGRKSLSRRLGATDWFVARLLADWHGDGRRGGRCVVAGVSSAVGDGVDAAGLGVVAFGS